MLASQASFSFDGLSLGWSSNCNISARGLPWWSTLPLQELVVQSLVRELRSHMLHTVAKKINKIKRKLSALMFWLKVCVCSVAKSYLSLWDPMDCSPPGSSVHEILQARIRSGLPFPPPGNLSNPGIEYESPARQVNSLLLCHLGNLLSEGGVSKSWVSVIYTFASLRKLSKCLARSLCTSVALQEVVESAANPGH